MKIPLKHIFAEVRPALQSVNVYVILAENVAKHLKIELTINGFDVLQNEVKESVIFFNETKKANLIILSAKENYLVFRFNLINYSTSGGLKAEVLNLQKSIGELKIDKNSIAEKKANEVRVEEIKKIECKNGCVLNEEDIKRAFKSPHFDYEPNEWFCHAHNVSDYSLKPNIFELQMTDYGFYVDKKLVIERVDNRDKLLFCKNCSQMLGKEVNQGIYKFYPDCVKRGDVINVNDALNINKLSISTCNREEIQSNISICSTLKIILHSAERNLGKVILTTSGFNCKEKQYLYVWVVEKNLLTYQTNECSNVLKRRYVNKVLFQYEDGSTPIADKWCKDFSTVLIDVSETMLEGTLNYLREANRVIPHEFSSTNGLNVSFFSM